MGLPLICDLKNLTDYRSFSLSELFTSTKKVVLWYRVRMDWIQHNLIEGSKHDNFLFQRVSCTETYRQDSDVHARMNKTASKL